MIAVGVRPWDKGSPARLSRVGGKSRTLGNWELIPKNTQMSTWGIRHRHPVHSGASWGFWSRSYRPEFPFWDGV